MQYMGSKNRIAKYILPIMLKERKEGQTWVEPFVGGANMIDKVEGKRIGADLNEYLIKALCYIRDEVDKIPDLITEEDYQKSKDNMKLDGLTGFIGFAMSFGAMWYSGYRYDVAGTKGCVENMKTQTRRSKQSAVKQSRKLASVSFVCKSYNNLTIPPNSLIYCDPPYVNTAKYKTGDFDHKAFWQWCRDKVKEGHTVFVSEYNAPEDFECVWQKEIKNGLAKTGAKSKPIEKLFKYKG